MWGVFLTVIALRILLTQPPVGSTDGIRSVYLLFATGGEHWLQGTDTYSGACRYFQYWPGFAAFMSIFALLPYKAGSLLWTALNAGLLLYGGKRFADEFLPAGRLWAGLFLLLLLPMSGEGVFNQQSNSLLAGLILLGAVQIRRRRWWSGSLLLLLPALTKVAPLCFVLLLLTMFPRQLWWRMALCGAGLVLAPFLLQNPAYVWQEHLSWLQTLSAEDGARWAYRDAWTIWELLRDGHVTKHNIAAGTELYRLMQLAMAGLAFLACVHQRYLRGLNDRLAVVYATALGMAWILTFGPSTEVATCVVPAAAVAWSVLRSRITGGGFVLMLAAFALTAAGASGEVEYQLYHLTDSDWPKALLPAGGLLLWLWLLAYGGRPAEVDENPLALPA